MTSLTEHNPEDSAEVAAVQTPAGEPDAQLIDPATLAPVTPVGQQGPDDESVDVAVPVPGPAEAVPTYGPTVDELGRPAGVAEAVAASEAGATYPTGGPVIGHVDATGLHAAAAGGGPLTASVVVTPDAPATGVVIDASAAGVTSTQPVPAAGTAPAVVVAPATPTAAAVPDAVPGPDAVK